MHYAEQSLLGALLLEAHRLHEIGLLEPGHFSNHTHGEVFRAMRSAAAPDTEQHRTSPAWLNTVLAAARPPCPRADRLLPAHPHSGLPLAAARHRGEAVDPVTVLWEAQHRGLLAHEITPTDLLAMLSTPVGSPEHWGEKVLERALLSRAQTIAIRIAAFTDDPANSPHQLITGSRRALAELTAVRSRWHQATSPATPRTARPARTPAAPRAGPPARTAPLAVRATR